MKQLEARAPNHTPAKESPHMKQRVLLDSNLWRYIIDAGFQGRLLRVARHGNVILQIAPAIMFEALRLRDIPLRNRLVGLMTNRSFHRLMPEAYS